ncbi:hypothetical protein WMF30_19025 [Sorangium sp. So ce134]
MSRAEDRSGPGPAAALRARGAIEEALFALPDIPLAFDRLDLRDRLLRAIQCTYAVLDTPVVAAAHLDGLREAAAMAGEGRALLARAGDAAAVAPLGRALGRLDAAGAALRDGAEAVAQIQMARRHELIGGRLEGGPPPPRPFRASVGVPELHALARAPLSPHVEVGARVPIVAPAAPPPPPPRPRSFAELSAFASGASSPPAGGGDAPPPAALAAPLLAAPPAAQLASLPFEPAIGEVEALRRLGRDCLEDIAALRNLRKPNALESWLDQGPFEQRLLDTLDAFAALGGAVLPLVSLFHAEARAPDPERGFAVALALGCIDGADTVAAAVMTLKQSAPEELEGWFEGFWLAPSPAIDEAMCDLCDSARPDLVALALDVLHARGTTPEAVVLGLSGRAEPPIAWRVARALATALPRRDAIERLEQLCAEARDDAVLLAGIESLLRRGHGPAVAMLRSAADASPARAGAALPLLCLAGRAGDLDRLLTAANAAPSPRLVRGLGRFGHVASLGALLDCLHHGDRAVVVAASEALERITGAGLRETVEEPWEVDLPPGAAEAGALPVPTRRVERVAADPERWQAWIGQHARHLDPRVKMRAGVPFTPVQVVDELEARATPPWAREEAALELALVTGLSSRFSPHDWVARQQRHLAELRGRVAALGAAPGASSLGLWKESDRPAARPSPRPPAEAPADAAATDDAPGDALPPSTAKPSALAARVPALPFARVEPAAAPPGPEAPARPGRAWAAVTVALPAGPPLPASPLPFSPGARDAPRQAACPDADAGRAAAGAPELRLTLAQHASLCAELAVSPGAAEAIYARYGLESREERAAVDAAWRRRLADAPAERAAWQELYRRYNAYFTGRGAPPG